MSQISNSQSDAWLAAFSVLSLLSCLHVSAVAAGDDGNVTSEAILARVTESSMRGRANSYSCLREYRLRNYRFDKDAMVVVEVTYRPDSGKALTVLQQSGSPKLLEILEKLFASEVAASKPASFEDYEISAANYRVRFSGAGVAGGRNCYAIELIPKRKSKFLIKGTAWVDQTSYGLVRLEGVTATSLSIWVGTPHIMQDFGQVNGLWLPSHTGSVSSGFLLGRSELEIQYSNYLVELHTSPSKIADEFQQPQH